MTILGNLNKTEWNKTEWNRAEKKIRTGIRPNGIRPKNIRAGIRPNGIRPKKYKGWNKTEWNKTEKRTGTIQLKSIDECANIIGE